MDFKEFLEKPWWEETILLYIGLLNREWKDKANHMVKEILYHPHIHNKVRRRLWLLGSKALRDIQSYKRATEVAALARERLTTIINSDASLEERFEAGEILGSIGDPRIDTLSPPNVRIEAGEFPRGGDEYDDEKPVRQIYVNEFMVGKYLVTNEEFKTFIHDGGYSNKDIWTPEGWKWKQKEFIIEPKYWHDRKWNGTNFPVVGVSWYEVTAYAQWLSQKTGEHYRLPTETQWEKAARGPQGLIYPWGNEFNKNFCNSNDCGLDRTSPIGIFPGGESPYGCMDMAGNVWEWCCDWFGEDYYKECTLKNPIGPLSGSLRVVRGSSWAHSAFRCRAAFRSSLSPAVRNAYVGFRVVKKL
jgi:formylglycine-generating enzyme required for sulfatase activity